MLQLHSCASVGAHRVDHDRSHRTARRGCRAKDERDRCGLTQHGTKRTRWSCCRARHIFVVWSGRRRGLCWKALLQDAELTSTDDYIARLATDLGLAKDTIARSLRVLRDAGLITQDQSRASAGTFDPGRYAM